MTINIVGAGLAGLLAGNMLRHRIPVLHEAQATLPNNHSAVLRFRTSGVGDVLNIPFRKITMIKAHVPWKNDVADALAYSFKNSGKYRSDRSIIAGLTTADRWIAPSDLINRMSQNLKIEYGNQFIFGKIDRIGQEVISTMPMPMLMNALRYPERDLSAFNSVPGLNIKATIADCDAYVSLLVPNPEIPFSRISITGNELILEIPNFNETGTDYWLKDIAKENIKVALTLLGISSNEISDIRTYPQKYAKITPINEDERKQFMHWATVNHNVYSLGRFATWRPSILLDDLIKDIRKIDNWLNHNNKYDVARDR